MGKLTDVELRNCLKAGQPVNKTDGDGLTFTLSAKGTAAWTLRYRFAGQRKELTLGRYPDMSIAKARELAAEKRVAVSQGVDVAQEKQARKESAKLAATLAKVGTVKTLYDEFLPAKLRGSARSRKRFPGCLPCISCRGLVTSKLQTFAR